MENFIKSLTQKNEDIAMKSAKELLNSGNEKIFALLCEKSDFLFDFIKTNVCKRLYNAADEKNFLNVIKFFTVYDENYADVLLKILQKFPYESLRDEMLEILKNGNENQKAYCARYFEQQPYEKANDLLNAEAFCEFSQLKENAIKALAKIHNTQSVPVAYEKLNSSDGFEVLQGISFLTNYPELSRLDDLIIAANNCSMSENAAEEIANAVDVYDLVINRQNEHSLTLLNSLINGFGEILPLYLLIDYKIFAIARDLINESYEEENSQVAQILLNMYSKFKLMVENDEYTYDEDIETKNELKKLLILFSNQGECFWDMKKEIVFEELSTNNEKRIFAALQVIKELELTQNIENIAKLTDSDNEMIVCLAIETLAQLKKLDTVNIEEIKKKINNPNILAIVNNVSLTNKS